MFVRFILYAWMISAFVSIAIAVERGHPIVRAFYPIYAKKALFWQIIMLVWCGMLTALDYYGSPPILGQRPLVWSAFTLVAYLWICLGNYYRNER